MKAYFVSSFGDICMDQNGSNVTITTTDLTVSECTVLKQIVHKYNKIKFKDISCEDFEDSKIVLDDVKLEDVHKFMARKLKGGRPTLTAIKLKSGELELVGEIKDKHIKDADASVTTDKPVRGCPMPEITRIKEVRASKVLKIFLTPQQVNDFERTMSFISVGNWTKRTYMITSRWSPDVQKNGQVYDIVNKHILCANCQNIPPSEEMLAMKLSIELNENEFLNGNL